MYFHRSFVKGFILTLCALLLTPGSGCQHQGNNCGGYDGEIIWPNTKGSFPDEYSDAEAEAMRERLDKLKYPLTRKEAFEIIGIDSRILCPISYESGTFNMPHSEYLHLSKSYNLILSSTIEPSSLKNPKDEVTMSSMFAENEMIMAVRIQLKSDWPNYSEK